MHGPMNVKFNTVALLTKHDKYRDVTVCNKQLTNTETVHCCGE